MQPRESAVDVVIVGGGPVGCVCALSLADTGRRVLLLEAGRQLPLRLAGEWLHPAAAEILARWDILPTAEDGSCEARGFVVFPHDRTAPITLPYAGRRRGATFEHAAMVTALRRRVREDTGIGFLEGARVTGLRGQRIFYAPPQGPERSVVAALIVGADGRSSTIRRLGGIPDQRVPISSMAGLLLEGVDPPFEGFGHVILGGPGPALIYRIGSQRFRACLDVPLNFARCPDRRALLWESYEHVLPEPFRLALRRALAERPIAWAANQFRSRVVFGRGGLALVGDAVGHFHPLTAVGLTLGFQDAECLAKSPNLAAYGRERSAGSLLPELLATSLYQAFTFGDEASRAVCAAVYQVWRRDAEERRRTMRFLSAEETRPSEYRRTFLKVLTCALEEIVSQSAATRQWHRAPGLVRRLSGWLKWPTAGVLPRFLRAPLGLGSPSRRYSSA